MVEPVSDPAESSALAGSTRHRVRAVLAIRPFRRLWGVTALCAVGDWLSLLALSALATELADGYQAQSFALGGVVALKLLPAMVLGPLAGALADKLDRRKVMIVCDVLRASLFLSIPLFGSLAWLFVATFLIEMCALFWLPAKDASIPNLLRRPDQVETANQLSLVMTYGAAVLVASGLFTALSKLGPALGRADLAPNATNAAYGALALNGVAYGLCALIVATRIPELSGRPNRGETTERPGLIAMLREGAVFVARTPLLRGLVVGIIGAFAAGGAVIACARVYAVSLGGGDAAYGLLFASMFAGLGSGMAVAPVLSRRLARHRLFGLAIVAAGCSLTLVAVSPHLFVALATVTLVGCAAGTAFLTGLTIIGIEVADEFRGRTIAFVQSIVRVTLLGSMALVPVVVGLVQQREIYLFGEDFVVDGTRIVLAGASVVAIVVGLLAYRQMDAGGAAEPLLRGLIPHEADLAGVLVTIEAVSADDGAQLARGLVDGLRDTGLTVVSAGDPDTEQDAVRRAVDSANLSGVKAQELVAAAVEADVIERWVEPALRAGAVVVLQRRVDAAPPDTRHPDLRVLIDRSLASGTPPGHWGEQHLRLHAVLAQMAAADPDRFLVVDDPSDGAGTTGRVLKALPQLTTRNSKVQTTCREATTE